MADMKPPWPASWSLIIFTTILQKSISQTFAETRRQQSTRSFSKQIPRKNFVSLTILTDNPVNHQRVRAVTMERSVVPGLCVPRSTSLWKNGRTSLDSQNTERKIISRTERLLVKSSSKEPKPRHRFSRLRPSWQRFVRRLQKLSIHPLLQMSQWMPKPEGGRKHCESIDSMQEFLHLHMYEYRWPSAQVFIHERKISILHLNSLYLSVTTSASNVHKILEWLWQVRKVFKTCTFSYSCKLLIIDERAFFLQSDWCYILKYRDTSAYPVASQAGVTA